MNFTVKGNKIKNLKENANFILLYTMLFTVPIFKIGCARNLKLEDLYETLPEHRSDLLGDKIEAAWNIERKTSLLKGRKPSLRRVLIKLFGLKFLRYGIITAFSELCLKMIQSIALEQLIKYYTPNQREISKLELYLFGTTIVLISLFNAFIVNYYTMGLVDLGMKIRISCSSLVYRKVLKLDKSTLEPATVGQVVNLISNDVNRFDTFAQFVNFLWITPIQIILVTIFVYKLIGLAALAGTFSVVVFVPLQLILGNKSAVFRLRTALRTDERIRLINEVINGIQVIKMYTLENSFAKLVASARRFEIQSIRKNSYILGIFSALNLIIPRISIYATIVTYVLFKNDINSVQVFVITALYNLLRTTVFIYFAYGIGKISETNISIKRINRFLLLEENNFAEIYSNNTRDEELALTISNGAVKWPKTLKGKSLSDISISVKLGSFLGVVGHVGSGKSTLLYTILRELPLITGTLKVYGEVSYASQDPWIFAGSIRQNILFGLPMDRQRYQTVLRKCALKEDLICFSYGDKTIIGDEGTFLSVVQKVKINLARAVYRDVDIYLLDDILSFVDHQEGKKLFKDCICNFLREKTVILVTHQLQYLNDINNVIILENGKIKPQSGFYELRELGADFLKLIADEKVKKDVTEFSLSHSIRSVSSSDGNSAGVSLEESKYSGTLSGAIYKIYFCIGSSLTNICLVIALFVFSQASASGSDFFLSYWVNQEEQLASNNLNKSASIGNVQIDVHSLHQFYSRLSQYFAYKSINIYSTCMAVLIIISVIRSFAYYAMCMRSSINLHDKAFERVSHATMAFFKINTSGRILNRFSKDMGAVDEVLPANMMDTLTSGLTVFGVIIIVAMANLVLIIPTIIFVFIFYKIRKCYTTTSSSVKRLEGITKSPVFTHLNSSMQGLTTIRASGVQNTWKKEFDSHQDLHSSAWHLYLVTARAFGFSLDLLCVAYIAVVTFSFFISSNLHLSANVGLAITQVLGLTGILQWGVRQSTEMVNQMTSVERILELTNVDHEPALESEPNLKPPHSWPNKGKIQFIDVQLRYFSNEVPVLKKLNFTVHPEEKIGIVGRTGAGKSSLIAALFRLVETEGFIMIDDVVIQRIGLDDLRSKISIIPQNPVLFSGTLRKNLDPFNEYSDQVLWKILEEVKLKKIVEDLLLGLSTMISEGGVNFSVGQRHLICLAQAVVRKNKILILDEAMVNVDPQTDALIRSVIKRNFSNCTILTISHRLHSIMDSDKVLVMDEGRVVEFGRPYELLQNSLGYFYKMVNQNK